MSEIQLDSTEQKIKETARVLFLEKGLRGTTIREVAEKAGVNVALVNYYFRTKNKLFIAIFKEKFLTFNEAGYHILTNEAKPFLERIEEFIDHYIEVTLAQPNLPIFVLSELHFNDELKEVLANIKTETKGKYLGVLQKNIDQEVAAGNIRPVNFMNLEISMMSMMTFPFLTRKMITRIEGFSEEAFRAFVLNWKEHIKTMIFTFLKPETP
ncbi:MAG: TetR/AcrR family transcriptional regulator [Bacteroidia bacterium]|nr:TetR/AcrR family transcriptional regulator [Bacteroidia bacterium]